MRAPRRRVAVLEAERDAVEAELDDCDGKIKLAEHEASGNSRWLAQRDQMVKASAKDCERKACFGCGEGAAGLFWCSCCC